MLATAGGTQKRLPAGACWITHASGLQDLYTVQWDELGTGQSAQVSGEHLRNYLRGCMIQYD